MSEKSLLEHVESPQLVCLNEAQDHTLKSILATKTRNTGPAYLLSDADEQLLLNIPFNQTVKVKALVLHSKNAAQGPRKIKIFVNRASVGFEDVEDAEEPEAAQVLELDEAQITSGAPITLRFVRFQSVSSLQIFVVSNQGGEDESRIDALDVLGMTSDIGGARDLSGLGKQEE